MSYEVIEADVLEWAKNYTGPKFHALFCDPPYHLASIVKRYGKNGSAEASGDVYNRSTKGFMGKEWDGGDIAFRSETWSAIAEHLYPGAFLIAFSGSKGWHRQAVAMEDAGLIAHTTLFLWAQSQGFPKATRIDTQVDKNAGIEREVVGKIQGMGKQNPEWNGTAQGRKANSFKSEFDATVPATDLAQAWEGHRYGGQAIKPAVEPILIFQKPYSGRPVDSITATGAGALNIDGARIGTGENLNGGAYAKTGIERDDGWGMQRAGAGEYNQPNGRWPANFLLQHNPDCKLVGQREQSGYAINRFTDGAKPFGGGAGHEYETSQMGGGTENVYECVVECPVRRLNEQVGKLTSGKPGVRRKLLDSNIFGGGNGLGFEPNGEAETGVGDSGGASRFFFNSNWNAEAEERLANSDPVMYQAKAGRQERDAGLDGMPLTERRTHGEMNVDGSGNSHNTTGQKPAIGRNSHPTLKPLALCKWLATLLLPPDIYAPRRLLVPFAGSGSEMIGAIQAGWEEVIGIEREAEYVPLARARLKHWSDKLTISSLHLFSEK